MNVKTCFFYLIISISLSLSILKFPNNNEINIGLIRQFLIEYKSNNNYTSCCYLINSTKSNLINWLIKYNYCPFYTITNGEDFQRSTIKIDEIFLLFDNIDNILIMVNKLRLINQWNSESRLQFIITKSIDDESIVFVKLQQLWYNYRLINFIIIFINNNKLMIVSYNPFKSPKLVDFTQESYDKLFPDKLNNLNGYQLRISLYDEKPRTGRSRHGDWYGKDYRMLRVIIDMLNATYRIITPKLTSNFKEAYKNIRDNKTDFCFISRFCRDFNRQYEFSYPHEMESLVVIVPKSQHIPQSKSLLLMFDYRYYLLISSLIIILTLLLRISTNQTDVIKCLLSIWCNFLQTPNKYFDQHNNIGRFLLILWCFYGLLFTTTFQSILVATLIHPIYYKDIDTIQQLKESKLPIYTSTVYKSYLPESINLSVNEISVDKRYKMLKKFNNSVAYIVNKNYAKSYFMRNQQKFHNKPMFHVMKEDLVPGFNVYTFQKYSPFVKKISEYLIREQQYGLSQSMKFPYLKHTRLNHQNRHHYQNVNVIKLYHLQGVFYLLLIGHLFATIAFILEQCKFF